MKGQEVIDFLAQHPCVEVSDPLVDQVACINLKPWVLMFDGSRTQKGVGAGITIRSPIGKSWKFMCHLDPGCSNNQAEYETLILGLKILAATKANYVQVMGYSQLVIKQLTGEYKCNNNPNLKGCFETTSRLLRLFADAIVYHIPREEKEEANDLTQQVSRYKDMIVEVKHEEYPLWECASIDTVDSWKKELIDYIKDPSNSTKFKLKQKALRYVLVDDELYRRTINGVLLRCINKDESMKVMGEVHEGI